MKRLLVVLMLVSSVVMAQEEAVVPALSWLDKIGESTRIDGVYTAMTSGERGGGVAVHYALLKFDIKQRTRLMVGPAYVLCLTEDNGSRHLLEMAVSTKVLDAEKVQAAFQKIPFLGRLPLDISEVHVFVGGGIRVDPADGLYDKALGVTVGVGGIKWGR